MKIKLEVAYTNEEAISQLDSALEEIEDIKVEKFEQNGFDGFDLLYYFLETGRRTGNRQYARRKRLTILTTHSIMTIVVREN